MRVVDIQGEKILRRDPAVIFIRAMKIRPRDKPVVYFIGIVEYRLFREPDFQVRPVIFGAAAEIGKNLDIIVRHILCAVYQLVGPAPGRHRQHPNSKALRLGAGLAERSAKGLFSCHNQPVAGDPDFIPAFGDQQLQKLILMEPQVLNPKAF